MRNRVWMLAGVGLLTITAGAALMFLIFQVAGRPDVFANRTRYYIRFDDARGVGPGVPVRRSGVKVGQVSAVELEDTGQVRVTILLEPTFTPRRNEDPTIVRGLLGGDAFIDFIPRTGDKEPPDLSLVPPETEFVGKVAADTRSLLTQASGVLPTAERSLDQIRRFLDEASKEVSEFARIGREVMPELRRTNDAVQESLKAATALAKELRNTSEDVRVLARTWTVTGERVNVVIQTNERQFNEIVTQVNDATKRTVQTLDRISTLTEQAAKVLSKENQDNFAQSLKNLKDTTNDFRPLLTDSEELIKESRALVQRFRGTLPDIEATIANSRRLTQGLANSSPEIEATIQNFRKFVDSILGIPPEFEELVKSARRLTDSIILQTPELGRNLREGSEEITQLVREFREILRALARADGVVQRLLNDASLYANLNSTVTGVNRLLPRFDRILTDIEVFADKIARHPESLGVRGAVRPSDGLKTLPPQQPHVHPSHQPQVYPYR